MSARPLLACLILGGGGHARVLIDSMLASGTVTPYGVLDSDRSRWGTEAFGVRILGGDELLPEIVRRREVAHFVVGLGGVSDNEPRRRLFVLGLRFGLTPLRILHPSAVCSAWAEVEGGAVLLPGAIVNARARVGQNTIINTGVIVEHDCVVEDHVHVASGAVLASSVHVERLAHIGAGATVRQGLSIGEGAVVGAGAVVVRDVESWTVVVGVPARVLRRVSRGEPSTEPQKAHGVVA